MVHTVYSYHSDFSSEAFLIQLKINGREREFQFDIMHVTDLVSTLGLEGKRIALELNGEIVPRSTFSEVKLITGDTLEIVGAVGGG